MLTVAPLMTSSHSEGHESFVLVTAFNNTVMATRLRAWHGAGRSSQERSAGPDPAQVNDAALKMHMLHVNGTLSRVVKRLPLGLIQRTSPANLAARAKSWPLNLGTASKAGAAASAGSLSSGVGGRTGGGGGDSSRVGGGSGSGGGGGGGGGAQRRTLQADGAEGSYVFDYLSYKDAEGVACFDTQAMPSDPLRSSVRVELQQQFYRACATIRRVLLHPGPPHRTPFQQYVREPLM